MRSAGTYGTDIYTLSACGAFDSAEGKRLHEMIAFVTVANEVPDYLLPNNRISHWRRAVEQTFVFAGLASRRGPLGWVGARALGFGIWRVERAESGLHGYLEALIRGRGLQARWDEYESLDGELRERILDETRRTADDRTGATTVTEYDERVIEGVRLASDQGIDLFALARSVAEGIAAARPPGPSDQVWVFPHEAVRGLCALEFIDAAGIEDRRLEGASARASREAGMEDLFEVGLQVLHERGFTPAVDALHTLITTVDRTESI